MIIFGEILTNLYQNAKISTHEKSIINLGNPKLILWIMILLKKLIDTFKKNFSK